MGYTCEGLAGRGNQSAYADYPYYDAVGYSQVGHLMLPRDYAGRRKESWHMSTETEEPILSEEAAFTMLAGKTCYQQSHTIAQSV